MTPGKQGRLRDYERLFDIGLATVTIVLLYFNGADKVKSALATLSHGSPKLYSVLPVVLYALTVLIGLSWFFSGKHELSLLSQYYSSYVPKRSFTALPVVILAAVLVVLLAYYSDKILVYSAFYAAYLFFAAGAAWLSTQHFLKAYADASSDTSTPKELGGVFYWYYVQMPHPLVAYLCGAVTFLAITLAAMARERPQTQMQHLETMAYVVMFCAILLGELTVWSWRYVLYTRISAAASRRQQAS